MIVLAVVLLVLFVGVFAVTTGMIKRLNKGDEYDKRDAKKVKSVRAIACTVLAAVILLGGLIGGIRIIDSTEVGVVRTFGEINKEITSGLNFVNPLTDSVTTYDLRTHVRERAFASYTKDAQPLTSTVEYQYELIPGEVMDVAREYGTYEILESKLDNLVEEKAKVVMARYSAMSLLENRSTLSTEVAVEVEELEEMFHINFRSVIVKDIDFSDAFEASVEAKMTAEQDAMRAEQEKKTAIIKAEQAKEVARLEAEALEITRQALQNMPEAWITQQYLEKWDGKLPQIVTEGSDLLFTPSLTTGE